MRYEASTGITVSESTSEPDSANTIDSATGLNSLPSSPCSASSGRNTMTMIAMPEATGTRDLAHRAVDHVQPRQRCRWSCARCVTMFSTTTTAASTSMPMAMASPPRLIRFALMPDWPHQDEGGERRERQGDRHHQGGADVAEEQQQQHHDQDDGFERARVDTVPTARCDQRRRDRRTPRVVTPGGRARRELGELRAHAVHHLLRVGSAQAQHQPLDRLALAAAGDRAVAREAAHAHAGHVADAHGDAVALA